MADEGDGTPHRIAGLLEFRGSRRLQDKSPAFDEIPEQADARHGKSECHRDIVLREASPGIRPFPGGPEHKTAIALMHFMGFGRMGFLPEDVSAIFPDSPFFDRTPPASHAVNQRDCPPTLYIPIIRFSFRRRATAWFRQRSPKHWRPHCFARTGNSRTAIWSLTPTDSC